MATTSWPTRKLDDSPSWRRQAIVFRLHHGEIGPGVGADDFAGQFAAVGEPHAQALVAWRTT